MIEQKDIQSIARGIFTAHETGLTGRLQYLRALVEGAQEKLPGKGTEPKVQFAALQQTHSQYYEWVLEAADPFVPKHMKDRSQELHRRANFARTSLSALRNHVRAGGDIATVNAAKVTRTSLRTPQPPSERPKTARRFRATIAHEAKGILAAFTGLAALDKSMAALELHTVLHQLQEFLAVIEAPTTPRREPKRAGLRAVPPPSPATADEFPVLKSRQRAA